MKDRAMQALHLQALEPVAETLADGHSYGFRPERSTADALEQCFKALAQKDSAQWVLEGDIKGCFDNISHQWMLDYVQTDKSILQKWLKSGFIYQGKLFAIDAGTPQGGIISPTLMNRVLDGLQILLRKAFPRTNCKGKYINPSVKLVRYADDCVPRRRTGGRSPPCSYAA
jgi:RNA-directed DNA polymerase